MDDRDGKLIGWMGVCLLVLALVDTDVMWNGGRAFPRGGGLKAGAELKHQLQVPVRNDLFKKNRLDGPVWNII